MAPFSLIGIFCLIGLIQSQNSIVLQSKWIYMAFSPSDFSLTYLAKSSDNTNLLQKSNADYPLWSLELLTDFSSGVFPINASSKATRRTQSEPDKLTLIWENIPVSSTSINVVLTISLSEPERLVKFNLDVDATKAYPHVGLWSHTISVGPHLLDDESVMLTNRGWGARRACNLGACKSFSGAYPDLTYQFLSGYNPSKSHSGVYFAAHDPRGETKQFQFTPTKEAIPGGTYAISGQPADAGKPFKTYSSTYPVVLTVYNGGWFEASQIYRPFVLKEAQWVRKGHIATRKDTPKWLFELTTWVNSHWQQNDIFNTSGGDPQVVKNRVLNLANRFNLKGGLGLHWYEWDTLGYELGSNYTKCLTEVTCGFDTHYPEYFPVRTGFQESLKAMQDKGVKVAPYINGRIFDIDTDTWKRDNAVLYMAKNVQAKLNSTDLSIYEESYGSKAKFAVGCPHTKYWQEIIANTVGELVHQYHTNGAYIDQIAAATPKPCWDPTHDHTLGGGYYWVSGYRKMLDSVREKSGNDAVILTESNAEPFMDGINVYLTLVAFSGDFNGPETITPVFAAIYGGYYFSMGAEFFANDFSDPNVFAAKIAKQYMFGAQLGWFSLGGRDNQDPYMGIYDQLMNPKYDAEVAYLKLLADAKTKGNHWIQEGQAMRDLNVALNGVPVGQLPLIKGENSRFDVELNSTTTFSSSPVMSSAWFNHHSQSLLVTLSTVSTKASGTIEWKLQTSRYGFPESDTVDFEVVQLFPTESHIGGMKGCCVEWKGQIGARQVLSFALKPK